MDKILLALHQIFKNEVEIQGLSWWVLWDMKIVYLWDPILIPESNLPAIAIQPMSTPYNQRWSRYDEKTSNIEIRIVSNIKNFYNDTWCPADVVLPIRNTVLQAEKTDDLQSTKQESIAWIIQNNPYLVYIDGEWNEQRASVLTKVWWVEYRLSKERWYPTYEIVVTVSSIAIWDR